MRRSASRYASSFSFGPGPVSTTLKALIAANVVMFLVTSFAGSLLRYLGLIPTFVIHDFWIWLRPAGRRRRSNSSTRKLYRCSKPSRQKRTKP